MGDRWLKSRSGAIKWCYCCIFIALSHMIDCRSFVDHIVDHFTLRCAILILKLLSLLCIAYFFLLARSDHLDR